MAGRRCVEWFTSVSSSRVSKTTTCKGRPEETFIRTLVVEFVSFEDGISRIQERRVTRLNLKGVHNKLDHYDITGKLWWARVVRRATRWWFASFESLTRVAETRQRKLGVHSIIEPVWVKAVCIHHIPIDLEKNDRPDFAFRVTTPITSLHRVRICAGIDLEVGRVGIPSNTVSAICILSDVKRIVTSAFLCRAKNSREEIAPLKVRYHHRVTGKSLPSFTKTTRLAPTETSDIMRSASQSISDTMRIFMNNDIAF